jgi:hypothetical protein
MKRTLSKGYFSSGQSMFESPKTEVTLFHPLLWKCILGHRLSHTHNPTFVTFYSGEALSWMTQLSDCLVVCHHLPLHHISPQLLILIIYTPVSMRERIATLTKVCIASCTRLRITHTDCTGHLAHLTNMMQKSLAPTKWNFSTLEWPDFITHFNVLPWFCSSYRNDLSILEKILHWLDSWCWHNFC